MPEDESAVPAPTPGRKDRQAGLPQSWQRALALADVVAKLAVPVLIALVGWYVQKTISRIQAGPAFTELAIQTLEQDPLTQPEGVRNWAIGLLESYAGLDPRSDLAQRLESGWGFTAEAHFAGSVSLDLGASEDASVTVSGDRLVLRAIGSGEGGEVRGVEVSLPSAGIVVTRASLSPTEVIRIYHGPRAYAFRLEGLNDEIAEFSLFVQIPHEFSVPEFERGPPADPMPSTQTINER